MAVMYSQNGVIVRKDNNIGDTKINSVYVNSTRKGFVTQSFNLADATLIEENIVYKASDWAIGANFNLAGGQWYSGSLSKFEGLAVYLWADKIEIDYSDNNPGNYDFITNIPYDFSIIVRKNIIYDKITGIATCKIYYNNDLVCTYTKSISDLYLSNNVNYGILSNREGELIDRGYIDINKSYIRIDGKLVWGVDKSRNDEAIIGGKTYRTVKMPDGKLWLAENLDFKFCNVGGSGTPSTPNAWYYNNDETTYGWNGYKCGLLYNWHAVKLLEDHKSELCPGWHVPTTSEWDALATAVGGTSTAGTKLKAANVSWATSWGGTDDYGFAVLPAGGYNGSFYLVDSLANFWTITESGSIAYFRYFDTGATMNQETYYKSNGYSVRLVRDAT